MLVNGYIIKEQLKRWKLLRDVKRVQFEKSIWTFDQHPNSDKIEFLFKELMLMEERICHIETKQQEYNHIVKVNYRGEEISLAEAVKNVGAAGRLQKLWKNILSDNGDDRRYGTCDPSKVRKDDEKYAIKGINDTLIIHYQQKQSTEESELRAGINKGNMTEIEMDINFSLLEGINN